MLATFIVGTNAQAIDLVTKGDTTVSIGGYVKAEGTFRSPDDKDYAGFFTSFSQSDKMGLFNFVTVKLTVDAFMNHVSLKLFTNTK